MRFLITVQREVIVYGDSSSEAMQRATTLLNVDKTSTIQVVGCQELPLLESESHGPSIDYTPSSHASKPNGTVK